MNETSGPFSLSFAEFTAALWSKRILVTLLTVVGGLALTISAVASSRSSQQALESSPVEGDSLGVSSELRSQYIVSGFRLPRIALVLAGLPPEGVDLIYFPSPSDVANSIADDWLFLQGGTDPLCTFEPSETSLKIECAENHRIQLSSVERVVNRATAKLHEQEVESIAVYLDESIGELVNEYRPLIQLLSEFVPLTVREKSAFVVDDIIQSPPQAPANTSRNLALWFLGGSAVTFVFASFVMLLWAAYSDRIFSTRGLKSLLTESEELICPKTSGDSFESLRLATLTRDLITDQISVLLVKDNFSSRSLKSLTRTIRSVCDFKVEEIVLEQIPLLVKSANITSAIGAVKLGITTKTEVRRLKDTAHLTGIPVIAFIVD